MPKDFMEPFQNIGAKVDKLKKAGEKVTHSSTKSLDQKIQARDLLKKVIRGLPWEAKKAALDILRAEVAAGSKIPGAGTMDPDKLDRDFTAIDRGDDVSDYTTAMKKKDFRRSGGV